jgi:hypothetical protein
MKHNEADFTKQVLQLAKLLGWRSAHFRPGMMANGRWITAVSGDGKGFPDLVLVRGKRLLFVELKTDTGEMSDEQVSWMGSLFIAGAEVQMWTPSRLDYIQKELERE